MKPKIKKLITFYYLHLKLFLPLGILDQCLPLIYNQLFYEVTGKKPPTLIQPQLFIHYSTKGFYGNGLIKKDAAF